jgi:hypothetical protein
MRNKIKHFLVGSLVSVCIVCLVAFTALAVYLNHQNEQAVTDLGNIYMSNINDRISKHFKTISDQCLTPMATFAENTPPMYESSKDGYFEWVTYYGQSRGYESISWCDDEGNIETIYGDQIQFSGSAAFMETMVRQFGA